MTEDPFSDPFATRAWQNFAKRAVNELIPKLDSSACSLTLVPEGPSDIKFAVELGLSIMMDKPIIAVVPPGRVIPSHLLRVADEVVEMGDGFEERMKAALSRVLDGA